MSRNESKWEGYSREWNQMKPTNPRLQWTVAFLLHGTYDDHVHSTYMQEFVKLETEPNLGDVHPHFIPIQG